VTIPPEDDGFFVELDELDALKLRAGARLQSMRTDAGAAIGEHPWPFLDQFVYTLDQARNSIRPFAIPDPDPQPNCPCMGTRDGAALGCQSYLHHITNVWWMTPRLLVPKTRRMRVSWWAVACHTWLAAFRPGSLVGFASRKKGETDSEGSSELVRRAKFILEHLPAEAPPIKFTYQTGRIQFPDSGSEIIAIAQGPDQARQYTFTAYLADEMAFWEHAAATYGALVPTLEGGGRFTGISSANPGFFKQLVFDELGGMTMAERIASVAGAR
jgi:hypothetical protein